MLYRMRALYHYLGVRFPPGGLFVNWHIQYEGRGVLKLLPPSQRGDFSSGHTEGFSVSSSQSRRASCLFWQPPHQAGPAMLVDPKMFLFWERRYFYYLRTQLKLLGSFP